MATKNYYKKKGFKYADVECANCGEVFNKKLTGQGSYTCSVSCRNIKNVRDNEERKQRLIDEQLVIQAAIKIIPINPLVTEIEPKQYYLDCGKIQGTG